MFWQIKNLNTFVKNQYTQNKLIKNRFQALKTDDLQQTKETDTKLETITKKVREGRDLSPTELAYLKDRNPELYNQATRLMEEKKQLKSNLQKCRSKEECAKIYQNHTMQLATAATKKAISTDEYTSYKNGIDLVWQSYQKSSTYQKLPKEEKKDKLELSKEAISKSKQGG